MYYLYRFRILCSILEMRDYGLVDVWTQWYQADVHKCHDKADKIVSRERTSSDNPPRLSLKNLTGAFVILIGGIILSFLVYVAEKLFFMINEMGKNASNITTRPNLVLEL